MHEADREIGEHVLGQVPGHVRRRLEVERLGLLDERVHDVHLPARGDLVAQELVDLAALGLGPRVRCDRTSPRGELVDDGDLEVPVEGERERARDRRRRHHEEVRVVALLFEPGALRDTEAVLLVHDREPEPPVLDALLDERVGADDTRDLARRERRAPGRPLAGRQRRRQEADRDAEGLQELAEGHQVLLGQDLGRRHHRRLVPRLHGGEDGERRDDRLAGADVALEEPVHGARRGHVAADLVPHPLLRCRERIRQRGAEPADQLAPRLHRDPARARRVGAEDREAELEQEEVVEGEAAPRGGEARVGLREVEVVKRLRERHEPAPQPDRFGQNLGHLPGERVHEAPHERAQRPLRQPLRERVDRHEPARVQAVVLAALDDLVVGLLDDDRALVAGDLAVQHELLAALEDAREIAAAEPARGRVAARVPQEHAERRARPAGRRWTHADDRPRARGRLAGLERAEGREARAVLVAERDEEERVLDGGEPLPLQLLRAARAHALDVLERRAEARRRRLLHARPCAIQCVRLSRGESRVKER